MSDQIISKSKLDALKIKMQELEINESDLIEKFIRGSGAGGQKINKTSSTVYLKHEKYGIELKCQKTRKLSLNRYFARRLLCEMIEERIKGEESAKQKLISKIRKQKAKRSKKAKEKMLHNKKMKGSVKETRKKVIT